MPHNPAVSPAQIITRRDLLALLGAAIAAAASACSSPSQTTTSTTRTPTSASSPSSTAATTGGTVASVSCVLSPEMTDGPYYINGEAVRSDITEGTAGAPLQLVLTVNDATHCQPISGAAVEVWHADATGNYSGFGSTTSNRTLLRGVQMADTGGRVVFKTIYPGWYQGRSVHIHVKVHVGGAVIHTGQLFFDESLTDSVYAHTPYNSRAAQRTTNARDSIYANGGRQSTLQVATQGAGYVGTLALVVRA
jgi:protocatechuate 3,4-dioxygenase beta subunit